MSESYSLSDYVADLRQITSNTDDENEIISHVGPLAQRLALDKTWLQKKHYEANPEQGFGAFLLHEEPDHSLAVFVVNWLPGRGAPPHDHGTWAVVAGVEGLEKNTSYRRIDNRDRPGFAELEVKKEAVAGPGDLVCMKTGGIHSVHNDTENISLSLHSYGRHVNHTDRSQFDLETQEKKDFIVSVD
jgi:predicted metal-dependent enzyme (double-stranded beta helix superfamily)